MVRGTDHNYTHQSAPAHYDETLDRVEEKKDEKNWPGGIDNKLVPMQDRTIANWGVAKWKRQKAIQ
jgi:hypothetical protein